MFEDDKEQASTKKKVTMMDIMKLPIYRTLFNVFRKIPKKEILVKIIEGMSNHYKLEVKDEVKNSRISSLLWLNIFVDLTEKYICSMKHLMIPDIKDLAPIKLDGDREETVSSRNQRVNLNNINTSQICPVQDQIDLMTLYLNRMYYGELSDDE